MLELKSERVCSTTDQDPASLQRVDHRRWRALAVCARSPTLLIRGGLAWRRASGVGVSRGIAVGAEAEAAGDRFGRAVEPAMLGEAFDQKAMRCSVPVDRRRLCVLESVELQQQCQWQ